MSRVVVIGFDAAEPSLIEKWVAEGLLPNVARLQQQGSGGPIQSTIQPISPAAWSTIVTGCNPGKHGVFDWYERDSQHYHQAQIVRSSSIRVPTLWERCTSHGLTSGIFNVPMTFPPQPLNGWLVSGILTPPGIQELTYPKELRAELDIDGRYKTFFGVTYREGEEESFLSALHETLEHRGKALLHLLEEHPTDLTFAVFMESDHVMHYFWKHMDDTHPSHRPEHEQYHHAIRDVYIHLDRILGEVMDHLNEDDTLFLVSDHGSGPHYAKVYINKLLMQHDLLRLRRKPTTRFKVWLMQHRIVERIYSTMRSIGIDPRPLVPKKVRQTAIHSGINILDIDWANTKAYASGEMGYVSVNLAGREGHGSVDPRDAEAVIDDIIAVLDQLTDEDGEPIVEQIWRSTALYHGVALSDAPDVIFGLKGWSHYAARIGLGLHVAGVFDRPTFGRIEVSGGHALHGILYGMGPGIKASGTVQGMDLTQVAPTVLYRLGLPISTQIDGQVVTKMFTEASLSAHPIRYVDEDEHIHPRTDDDSSYTPQESQQVESRLRDLGYLE